MFLPRSVISFCQNEQTSKQINKQQNPSNDDVIKKKDYQERICQSFPLKGIEQLLREWLYL